MDKQVEKLFLIISKRKPNILIEDIENFQNDIQLNKNENIKEGMNDLIDDLIKLIAGKIGISIDDIALQKKVIV